MAVEIIEIKSDRLAEYGKIPTRYKVASVFQIKLIENGLGGMTLHEEEVITPYIKDYDSYEEEGPERWLKRFNTHHWAFFLALDGDRPFGGATVAFDTPNVNMLDGRKDLAVLWDIRVHPDSRRQGVGTKLFKQVVEWSKKKGCRHLKIETQNINVPACRFYAKQGCKLGAMDRYGYYGHPKVGYEVMMLWYLELE